MTTWGALPFPSLADEAQKARLFLFKMMHPDVKFAVGGERPAAWVDGRRTDARDLRELLDKLDRRFKPRPRHGRRPDG